MSGAGGRAASAAGIVARADALRARGDFDTALDAYSRALALDPARTEARRSMVAILQKAHTARHHPWLASLIAGCLADPGAYHQALSRPAALQVRLRHGLDGVRDLDGPTGLALIRALESDRLFRDLLAQTIVVDAALERFLVRLRRRLLFDPAAAGVDLPAALALQCVHNEYAWWAEPDEIARAESLGAGLGENDAQGLATVAMYRPPHELPIAADLLDRPETIWPEALRPLIRTVRDRQVEQSIACEIESFADPADSVSRAVGAQYEENPYPRWIGVPPPASKIDLATGLRRKFPHAAPLPNDHPLQVLCAGSGTGLYALSLAASYVGAVITGVDLSRRSLAYAIRRARELGLGGVRFLHGDILAIGRLGQRFDVIEAVGVIHHMADPRQGLARLVSVLKPGGVIRLGLYGEHRRRAVVEARRRIAALGLDTSARSIRLLRRVLLTGPAYRDLAGIVDSPDFYSLSGARDLLLHVHEHRFTIEGIRDVLRACGLEFLGFETTADGPPGAGSPVFAWYRAAFPHDPEMQSLDNWAALERREPSLMSESEFSGYIFWAQMPQQSRSSDVPE